MQVVADVESQTVYEGENVTITFDVQGQPDITYEWYEYRNGQEYKLSNFTGPSMTVYTMDIADNGVGYYCKADNGISYVYSSLAVVTVKVKTQAPTLVKSGTPVTMSVLTSAEDATYQWQEKNPAAAVSKMSLASAETDGWNVY